jgi:hypothetical protein
MKYENLIKRVDALKNGSELKGFLVDDGGGNATLKIFPDEEYKFNFKNENDLLAQVKKLNLSKNLFLMRFYSHGIGGAKVLEKEEYLNS